MPLVSKRHRPANRVQYLLARPPGCTWTDIRNVFPDFLNVMPAKRMEPKPLPGLPGFSALLLVEQFFFASAKAIKKGLPGDPLGPATLQIVATAVEPTLHLSVHEGYQPQPLRSANDGVAARRSGKYAAHVDTFDVVESVAGNPAEPWLPDQVAALSHMYENRDTLFANQAAQKAAEADVQAYATAQAAQRIFHR